MRTVTLTCACLHAAQAIQHLCHMWIGPMGGFCDCISEAKMIPGDKATTLQLWLYRLVMDFSWKLVHWSAIHACRLIQLWQSLTKQGLLCRITIMVRLVLPRGKVTFLWGWGKVHLTAILVKWGDSDLTSMKPHLFSSTEWLCVDDTNEVDAEVLT